MDYLPLDNGTQLNVEEESVAKIIINNCGDVNTEDKYGNTPLHYAVKTRNLEITKLVIDHGGDVNAMKTYGAAGQTPLHLAVLNGDKDIVNLLLMRGASVNAKDMSGSTPLHISLANGNLEMDHLPLDKGTELNGEEESVAKIIITNGADVNAKNTFGNTPLHYAAERGSLEITKLIIDHGGDVNARNKYGSSWKTPLYYALKRENCDIAELLLMNKANLKEVCEPFFIVLKNGFIQFLELLLKFTGETDTKISDDIMTHLISNAANNIKKFIALLLENGANVNARPCHGITTLHYAAELGCEELVRIFLDYGAIIRARKCFDKTKLCYVCNKGFLGVISVENKQRGTPYLFSSNEVKGMEGAKVAENTSLHLAAQEYNLQVVKILLQYGADVNATDWTNSTPLHCSTERGSAVITQLLLDSGANVNAKDREERTALHKAAFAGFIHEHRSKKPHSSWVKNNVTIDAEKCYLAIVRILLKNGADVNARTSFRETPIHHSAERGSAVITQLLLDNGANINAKDREERTALHKAAFVGFIHEHRSKKPHSSWVRNNVSIDAEKCYLAIVRILLKNDADVNAKDKSDSTALHILLQNERPKVNPLLLEKGTQINSEEESIAKLIITNGCDVNATDEYGNTPLHYAAKIGNLEIAKVLLMNNANLNEVREPLILVVKNGFRQFLRLLLKYTAEPDTTISDDIMTRLISNETNNITEFITVLMENGANVNAKDSIGITSLHYAVDMGCEEFMGIFLKYRTVINSRKPFEDNALPYVPYFGSEFERSVIFQSLTRGLGQPFSNDEVKTMERSKVAENETLHFAAQQYNLQVVKLLLEYGADVNARSAYMVTPIQYCVQRGSAVITQLLLDSGAEVNAKDKDGMTAIHKAAEGGFLNALISEKVSASVKNKLHIEAEKCYVELVSILLKNGADVNSKDKGGYMPIHFSARNSNLQILKILLECGADVNARSSYMETPLHYSAGRGSSVITQLLLDSGAEVNAKDEIGMTAIHRAAEGRFLYALKSQKVSASIKNKLHNAEKCYVELVSILWKNGADVNSKDNEGRLPIHVSADHSNLQILKILLEYGADVNATDWTNKTLLHYSARRGSSVITQLLLDNGADINAKDSDGRTALYIAANSVSLNGIISKVTARGIIDDEKCYAELVRILLQNDADVNLKDNKGWLPIHFSAKNGNLQILKILLEYGADVNATDWTNNTPLHYSAESGRSVITQLLLDSGADVNAKDKDGKTALHEAAEFRFRFNGFRMVRPSCMGFHTQKCYAEVVVILLQNGADINSKDNKGNIPLHFSVRNGNYLITKVLLNNGSDIDTIKDMYGNVALYAAVEVGFLHTVKLLLQYWANPNSHILLKYGVLRTEVISILLDYGCLLDEYMEDLNFMDKNMVKKHIVKLSAAGLREPVYSRNNYTELRDFREMCEQEIKFMKREMINNKISFYDVLVMHRNKLANYLRYDRSYEPIFGPKDYKITFPIYAGMIETSVRKQKLFQVCCEVLQSFSSLSSLPFSCTEKICSYLSEYDLRNIIIVCNLSEKVFGNYCLTRENLAFEMGCSCLAT